MTKVYFRKFQFEKVKWQESKGMDSIRPQSYTLIIA